MPAGTRVHRCKERLVKKGYSMGKAIRACQVSTNQVYATGKRRKRRYV